MGSRKAARFFSQVMYHLWVQNEPRIVPGLGWTFPGQRMYHFWVYFGTFPVPEVEQKSRYPKMEQWCTETVPDLVQSLCQEGKDWLFLHLCTNMRPRLTHIWAETGTENGSLLKEKGMTSCAEPYGAVKGLRKELSCKQCLQILQIASRLHVVTDPYGL